MIELHPHVEADIDGQVVVKIAGGDVTLDSFTVPYTIAHLEVPWDDTLNLDDLDPRDDVRIIISAANTGHWEFVPDGPDAGTYPGITYPGEPTAWPGYTT